MGRRSGRVVLRRIEDRLRRGICFRKRLAGMEKKAEELAVLCDAHVGFLVIEDHRLHHFAAPGTIESIVERYKNFLEERKGVHGRHILEKSKSEDFQVPKETIDLGLNNGGMRSINETDISTLNMDQLSQTERVLKGEIRLIRARKLKAIRIARMQKKLQVQVQGKAKTVESSSTEMPSGQEKRQAGGHRQSAEEVEVVLSNDLSLGGSVGVQHHRTPFDLNMPCRDAGPLR